MYSEPVCTISRWLAAVDGSDVYVERLGQGEEVVLIHGFGWSERPRQGQAYSFDNQVKTVLGVLDALGIERAHLIGHSYGGGIALWLASHHPQRVRSLVLMGSLLPGTEFESGRRLPSTGPLTPVAVRWMLRRGFLRMALESPYYDPGKVDDALGESYRERLRVEGVEPFLAGSS